MREVLEQPNIAVQDLPLPVARTLEGPSTGVGAAQLLALAASGGRIAGAQSLAEWQARLVEEIAAHIPGARATVYLAGAAVALPDSADDAPLRASLWVGETYLGQVIVQLAASEAVEERRALVQVLAQMAAPRLAALHGAAGAGAPELDLLKQVQRLGLVLDDQLDLPALYAEVVRVAAEMTGAESAVLLLENRPGGDLILQAGWGLPKGVAPHTYIESWSVADRVLADGEPLRIEHAPSDPRYTRPAFALAARSLLAVPVRHAGQVAGVLAVLSHTRYAAFGPAQADVLALLSHYASMGMDVAGLLEDRHEQIQQLSFLYAAVRKTRDYLQALVTGSGEAIITLDPVGNVLSWNPAASALLGYRVETALGRSLAALISPPGSTQLHDLVANVMRAETVSEFELVLRRADGSLVESEVTLSPVCDMDGQVLGVSMIGRDISARLATQREIRRHNQDLQVVNQVTTVVNQALDAGEMMAQALRIIYESCDLDAAAMLTYDGDGGVSLVVAEQAGGRRAHFAPQAGVAHLLNGVWTVATTAGERALNAAPPEVLALLARLDLNPVDFRHTLLLQASVANPALLILGRRRAWSDELGRRLLFETIAWQLGLGLNKAQLYDHITRTARVQSGLYDISRRIQSTPDIAAALPDVLDVLIELARADGGEIYLAPYPGASTLPRPSYPVARWGTPLPTEEGCHMALPLRRGAHDLGRIVLWRGGDGSPFADDDMAVAGAVADQLALALENRSLLARDLAALYETPAVKSAPLDLAQLTQRLLHQALTIAGVPGGAALLYDAATDDWEVAAAAGDLPAYWPLTPMQQRPLLDRLRQGHEPVLHGPVADAVLLLVPVLAGDRVVGAFALPGPLGPGGHSGLEVKLPFLSALAGRAGVLIDNMQLQLRAETLLIMEERNRIARAMHDGLAQGLTQIRNHCELISRLVRQDPARAERELAQVRADLKRSAGEVVRVIHALHPLALEEQDLASALQRLAEPFTIQGRLQVDLNLLAAPPNLPPQIELILFRVAQEALSHVAYRAGATHCRLALAAREHAVVFTLQDNGGGFGRNMVMEGAADLQHGLRHLYERIAEFGGELDVLREPGVGTRLVVTLPYGPARPDEDSVREGDS